MIDMGIAIVFNIKKKVFEFNIYNIQALTKYCIYQGIVAYKKALSIKMYSLPYISI